jgi:D-sedoheptulose 7-phosphate isomerase
MISSHLARYFEETAEVARRLDLETIDRMVVRLERLCRERGRLFICGVGGSAANSSHAVNDFRKLAGIEAYAPTDNVAELTARTNDEGWDTVFAGWLRVSRAGAGDVLFVLSVGGGNRELGVSANLVAAIDEAKARQMDVLGIVGRDGGYTRARGDIVLVIPIVNSTHVTYHTEAFQAVVWHALVSDQRLAVQGTKWETLSGDPGELTDDGLAPVLHENREGGVND